MESSLVKNLVREPLLHFLLLGALIFGAFKLISSETIEPGKILITQGQIESFETAFSRTWRRPPTATELEGLIRDYVRTSPLTLIRTTNSYARI